MSEKATGAEFKDHFSKLARLYSAFRPTYPDALFDYLAGLCRERHLAWDCACGSGQATLPLAERFEAVLGTDASPKQVAAATRSPRIEYRVAPASASSLDPESVDLVTAAQALHWFDLEPFYGEVKRVLRSGGVLAVWTYGTLHVDGDEIDRLIQEFYHDIVGPYWPPERRLVEERYRGLSFPFTELMPPAFRMEERWEREHLSGYLRTWSATGHYVEHTGVDPVSVLETKLAVAWPDPHSARLVTWPVSLRAGRKS